MTCFRDSPTKRVADLDFTHPITITEGPAPWRGAQVIATAPLLANGIRAFVRIDVDGAHATRTSSIRVRRRGDR